MRTKLEEIVAFLAGRADPETDARVRRELEDPGSEASLFLRGQELAARDPFGLDRPLLLPGERWDGDEVVEAASGQKAAQAPSLTPSRPGRVGAAQNAPGTPGPKPRPIQLTAQVVKIVHSDTARSSQRCGEVAVVLEPFAGGAASQSTGAAIPPRSTPRPLGRVVLKDLTGPWGSPDHLHLEFILFVTAGRHLKLLARLLEGEEGERAVQRRGQFLDLYYKEDVIRLELSHGGWFVPVAGEHDPYRQGLPKGPCGAILTFRRRQVLTRLCFHNLPLTEYVGLLEQPKPSQE